MRMQAVPVLIMAVIAIYVGVYHLSIFLRRPKIKLDLVFSLLCFSFASYDILALSLQNAENLRDICLLVKMQFVSLGVIGVAYLWFVNVYTSGNRSIYLYLVQIVLSACALIIVLTDSNSLFIGEPKLEILQSVIIPNYHLYKLEFSSLINIALISYILIFIYIYLKVIRFYYYTDRAKGKPLIIASTFFFLGIINDTAIVEGLYSWIYVLEFTFIGILLMMVSTLTDELIEAGRIKKRLVDSEQRYRVLFECSPIGIMISDERKITFANNRLAKVFGYDKYNELIDKEWVQYVDPEDHQLAREKFSNVMSTGTTISMFEMRCIDRNGKRLILEVDVARFQYENQVQLIGFVNDITSRKQAESSLEESEQKFRMISEQSLLAIIIMQDGIPIYANKAYAELIECPLEEILTWQPFESLKLIHPDDREFVTIQSEKKMRGDPNAIINYSYRGITRTGKQKWVEQYSKTISYEGRKALFVTLIDITSGKKTEQALVESERSLQAIFNATRDYVFLLRKNGAIITTNNSFADYIGSSVDDLVGQRINDLVSITDDLNRKVTIEKSLQKGEPMLIGGWIDNSHIEASIFPVIDETDHISRMAVFARDVTERKIAEIEIQRRKRFFQNLIDSMPSTLVAVDLNCCITEWNRSAQDETGLGHDEAIGRGVESVFPYLAIHIDLIQKSITGKKPEQTRVTAKEDSETSFLDLMIYPLISDEVEGAVIRIDDVSTRVRIEDYMMHSEKMISVGGLAAGMAHEINNPLGIILLSVTNILRRISPDFPKNKKVADQLGIDLETIYRYLEEQSIIEFIDSINVAVKRVSVIVKNLLSFSLKSDSGKAPDDMVKLVDSSIDLAANDYDLKKKYNIRNIKIIKEYDTDLPLISVHSSKIEHVILNLVRNAAQAISELPDQTSGIITVRIFKDDENICIEIKDNGSGITEKVKKRVFEPFFTTKAVGVGIGLGLSVSYFIIAENHNGTIEVESTPGKGSVFLIKLPL